MQFQRHSYRWHRIQPAQCQWNLNNLIAEIWESVDHIGFVVYGSAAEKALTFRMR